MTAGFRARVETLTGYTVRSFDTEPDARRLGARRARPGWRDRWSVEPDGADLPGGPWGELAPASSEAPEAPVEPAAMPWYPMLAGLVALLTVLIVEYAP